MKEQDACKPLLLFLTSLYFIERFIADNPPEFFAAFDRLHAGDQSTHAVANEHHLVQHWGLMVRIEVVSQFG